MKKHLRDTAAYLLRKEDMEQRRLKQLNAFPNRAIIPSSKYIPSGYNKNTKPDNR